MKSQISPVPRPWTLRAQGDANHYCIIGPGGRWVLGLLHNGEAPEPQQVANLRFLARAVNAHDALVAAARAVLVEAKASGISSCYENLEQNPYRAPDGTPLGAALGALRAALGAAEAPL